MTEEQIRSTEADAAQLWNCGISVEALINFLRDKGLNQPRSVDALVTVAGIDREDAQLAVLDSATWRDQYARNLELHEQLAQALVQLSQEGLPGIRVILNETADNPADARAILKRTCNSH